MNQTKTLTQWAISQIKTNYPDDIALLVGIHGHSVNNDEHGECFDYFIPATERGNELAQTFIIDGIGYDLYPRSWECTEKTARLEDTATLVLANAKILYSRSPEDEARFWGLREQLFANLANPAFTYRRALELLNIAMDLYRTLVFEDQVGQVRMAAGLIVHYLTLAVTYLNGTYEKEWGRGALPHLMGLECVPQNFVAYYQDLLAETCIDKLKKLSEDLIATTRRFLAHYTPPAAAANTQLNFQDLADWYQEVSQWWRRIKYHCDKGDRDAAFQEAVNLQSELNIIQTEYGLKEMDLTGSYQPDNLSLLAARSQELEDYILKEMESHGVQLKKYDSLQSFLAQYE